MWCDTELSGSAHLQGRCCGFATFTLVFATLGSQGSYHNSTPVIPVLKQGAVLASIQKAWLWCLSPLIKDEENTSSRIPRAQSWTKGSGVTMTGLDQSFFHDDWK